MKKLHLLWALQGLFTFAGACGAQTLNFDGLKDQEKVLSYYKGGFGGGGINGGNVSGPGPNYGVSFSADALTLVSKSVGGTGNFTNPPTPANVIFFLTGSDLMNVSNGFTNGLSFYYTSRTQGSVTVWSDYNGTGTQIALVTLLPITQTAASGFDTWTKVNIVFDGIAKSVNFSGSANRIAFDSILLGPQDLVTPGTNITGQIALEGVDDLSAVPPTLLNVFHIGFRAPGTTTELYGFDLPLTPVGSGSAFGAYAIPFVPTGTYDVWIKGSNNLASLNPGVVIGNTTAIMPDTALGAGDANGDNVVDTSDFNILAGAFGAIYDPAVDNSITGYDPMPDFNHDGAIDTMDFNLLVGQFGNPGAP